MRRGFALVEVVVAVALFGLAGLAGAALLASAAGSAGEAESRERLLWAASSLLDSLGRVADPSSGERRLADGARVRWMGGAGGGALDVWPRDAEEPWLTVPLVSLDPS